MRKSLLKWILVVLCAATAFSSGTRAMAATFPDHDDSCAYLGLNYATKMIYVGAIMGGFLPATAFLITPIGAPIVMESFSMTNVEECHPETYPKDNKITYCYDDNWFDGKSCSGHTHTLDADKKEKKSFSPGLYFKAAIHGDKVCIDMVNDIGMAVTMGCKYREPKQMTKPEKACFVSPSCMDNAYQYSQSFLAVTGIIAQCVKETLDNLFINTATECGGSMRTNLFTSFQEGMRRAIMAALTLYLVVIGLKVALGQELPKQGELFMLIVKFALVSYFAVGDGIQKDLYPAFVNSAASLANIMFQAGGARGLCEFQSASYHPGYGFLALWDSLDCRIAYYLGMYNPNLSIDAGKLALEALITAPLAFTLIVPLFWMFQLAPILFFFLFATMFISIAVYAVHTFLIAMTCLTITMYLGPLFIPMALFKQTKGYFDSWIKLLFAYTIQPMVIFAFLALMLTVFDNVYYDTCRFTYKDFTVDLPVDDSSGHDSVTRPYRLYYIDGNKSSYATKEDYKKCTQSFGYKMDQLKKADKDAQTTMDAIFFKVNVLKSEYWETSGDMLLGLVTLTLFGFLFYYFVEILGDLAADLTGMMPTGRLAIGPKHLMNKIGAQTLRIADKLTSKGASKAMKATENAEKGGGSG